MAGEIFISYRRADMAWARLLHDQLKAEGVEAWYDAQVGPGQDWRIETARALENSRIFVLLFSASAAQSSDIAKELAAATLEKKLIVPVRLENIAPKGAFLYELAARNWIDAYQDTEAKLAALARRLAQLVRDGTDAGGTLVFDRMESDKAPIRSRRTTVLAAIALAVVLAAAAWFLLPVLHKGPDDLPNPAGVSVAVLPFLNLSPDKSQDFFSDGMTEELTSALAKVPGLTVIGRTSAFQFKGENRDMRAIGRALGAKDLIEGSVRKDGDEVRITAQLIRAEDGTHLWTESYDRQLKSIFAVQEDIATAIAGALRVPLGLKQGQSLVSNRTIDPSAYEDYLRGIALVRARKLDEAIPLLKNVVARNPDYAPAWAALSGAYSLPNSYARFDDAITAGAMEEARSLARAELALTDQAARRAIQLDPANASAYAELGGGEGHRGNWAASEDDLRHALALDPNSPEALYGYGYLLAATGRLKQALQVQNRLMALEPFVPIYRSRTADLLWALGQNTKAQQIFEPMTAGGGDKSRLAKLYASMGRYADSADALQTSRPTPQTSRAALEIAAKLMRAAPAKVADPAALPLLPGTLSFVYLFIGADSRSLDVVERQIDAGYYGGLYRDPWAPASAALRRTEAFKVFVRKTRLEEYWRTRGWPQFCHPVGDHDFACK